MRECHARKLEKLSILEKTRCPSSVAGSPAGCEYTWPYFGFAILSTSVPPSMERKGPPDWRVQAWSTITKPFHSAEIGHTFPVGSNVVEYSYVRWGRRFLGLAVPNGTAIFLSLSQTAHKQAAVLLNDRSKHKIRGDQTVFADDSDGIDWTEAMAASVIFAFTALEAFANEMIPEGHVWQSSENHSQDEKEYDKERIEMLLPLDTKLGHILPEVLNCANPKGTRAWERYIELKRVRHRLIHLKDRDRHGSGPDADTVWGTLVSIPAPHTTALAMIDQLLKRTEKKPNWRRFYPHRDR